MEKLSGLITILGCQEYVDIEIRDKASSYGGAMLRIRLTPAEFCHAAMGRLSHMDCEVEWYRMDTLGMKQEVSKIEFPCSEDFRWSAPRHKDRWDAIYQEALKHCPDGWEVDNYFGSQDSFGKNENGYFARATIRRWVKP